MRPCQSSPKTDIFYIECLRVNSTVAITPMIFNCNHFIEKSFFFSRSEEIQTRLNCMNEQLQESTDKVTDLEAILEATQLRLQQSEESHLSYRLKAQKILSEKEAFIKSMTSTTSNAVTDSDQQAELKRIT